MQGTTARMNGIIAELDIPATGDGPLSGKRFVAKDLFDVAGHVTGAGNPDWYRTHAAATKTASAVSTLLEAGAALVGKSCTDEFAYSIDGINMHFGAPANPQFPDRVSGGSSSGSASAVAACLVDFALGTDTGGSVRVPASYCGIYGFRPSHGRIAVDGVVPLAPSLDTVGWFAREPQILKSVGSVLLHDCQISAEPSKLLIAQDAFDFVEAHVKAAHNIVLRALAKRFHTEHVSLGAFDWSDCLQHFRIIQGREAWQCYGDWIEKTCPQMEQAIRDRFDFAKQVAEKQEAESMIFRRRIAAQLDSLLSNNSVLCIPTTWGLPPLLSASAEQFANNRVKCMQLTSIASLAGIPQVTVPIRLSDATSIGLSFLARKNEDALLLQMITLRDLPF